MDPEWSIFWDLGKGGNNVNYVDPEWGIFWDLGKGGNNVNYVDPEWGISGASSGTWVKGVIMLIMLRV